MEERLYCYSKCKPLTEDSIYFEVSFIQKSQRHTCNVIMNKNYEASISAKLKIQNDDLKDAIIEHCKERAKIAFGNKCS